MPREVIRADPVSFPDAGNVNLGHDHCHGNVEPAVWIDELLFEDIHQSGGDVLRLLDRCVRPA